MSYRLISESWPVARKSYRCIWCGESIAVGEKYRRERSVFDGDPQNFKWHLECDAAAADYFLSEGGTAEFSAYDNERGQS